MSGVMIVVLVGAVAALILGGIPLLSHLYSLNIKSKTVGDGQHGTARWATKQEIGKMYLHVPFEPEKWRRGEERPIEQGIVVGCEGRNNTVALVDTGDVHALMVGAAGVGKTAYWLYPCIEYACATGMSFLISGYGDMVCARLISSPIVALRKSLTGGRRSRGIP